MRSISHAPAKEMLRTMCVAMFGKEIAIKIYYILDHMEYKVQKHFTGEKVFVPQTFVRQNNTQAIEKLLRNLAN